MTSYRPRVMNVPFLDLWRAHEQFAASLGARVHVADRAWRLHERRRGGRVRGRLRRVLRREPRCVGVSNGLDGLRLALLAAGLDQGQEVIVPANTFIATVEAVTQAGRCRCSSTSSEDDFNLDSGLAEAAITDRTAALLPVHLYGQLADMRAVGELWRASTACRSSRMRARPTARAARGTAGTIGAGSGLQLLSGQEPRRDGRRRRGRLPRTRSLRRQHPRASRARPAREVPARALGLHGPARHAAGDRPARASFRSWTAGTRSGGTIAATYTRELDERRRPRSAADAGDSEPVWHLYVDPHRGARRRWPRTSPARGIGTGRHYPEPIHLSEAYRSLGYARGRLPRHRAHSPRPCSRCRSSPA